MSYLLTTRPAHPPSLRTTRLLFQHSSLPWSLHSPSLVSQLPKGRQKLAPAILLPPRASQRPPPTCQRKVPRKSLIPQPVLPLPALPMMSSRGSTFNSCRTHLTPPRGSAQYSGSASLPSSLHLLGNSKSSTGTSPQLVSAPCLFIPKQPGFICIAIAKSS